METESASNLSPSRPQGKSTDALLLELEDHVRMAENLEFFYQRYNPDQIKHLPKMLNIFFGKEEELCAELREKYKADLYGEVDILESQTKILVVNSKICNRADFIFPAYLILP